MYTRSIANRNEDPLELGSHRPTASSGTPVDQGPVSQSKHSILSHNFSPFEHSQSQARGLHRKWYTQNVPLFAHHNIIKKKIHQLRTFAWWFLTSTLISILILAHLNKSKGSETELKKSQLGKLSDFREIWCIIYFPCNPRARTQYTHLSVPVGSGKQGGL